MAIDQEVADQDILMGQRKAADRVSRMPITINEVDMEEGHHEARATQT